jgi:hypothetical protein
MSLVRRRLGRVPPQEDHAGRERNSPLAYVSNIEARMLMIHWEHDECEDGGQTEAC